MYKFLIRNGVLVGFLLAVLAIIITVIPIISGLDAFSSVPEKLQPNSEEGDIFGVGIGVTQGLLVIAIAAMVFLGIFGIFKDFKSSIKGVIGFVVLLIFFGILYATASTEVSGSLATTVGNPVYGVSDASGNMIESTYKLISGTITGTLLLLGLAIVSAIGMEIWNFFKTA